jgi:hypothetical protein
METEFTDSGSIVSAGELDETVFTIRANPDDVIILSKAINPCNITFHNEEGNIGMLTWEDGIMRFEGDAEESAQLFFDNVIDLWTRAGGYWGQSNG